VTLDLVSRLRRLGVRLRIEGDAVQFDAPPGAVTAELLQEMKEHKAELRQLLLSESLSASAQAGDQIPVVSRRQTLPLSFAQERLWFLDRLEPGAATYSMPAAIRLQGRLDLPVLEQVITALVQRHEVLRTTFATVDGRPKQIIDEPSPWSIPVTDLSQLGTGSQEAEVEALALREAQAPFDLTTGPLLRTRLLRISEQEHVLLLTMHHIICDGWSVDVLQREVAELFAAISAGRPPELTPLAIQYADFAVWQRRRLRGELLATQLSYWRDRLAGLTNIELPTDRPRPRVQSTRGAHHRFTLDAQLTTGLRRVGDQHRATLFMTLLAVFDLLLHRSTGQTDIAVGTPIANRNRAETEPLIGFFVNTLVMRADVAGDPTFSELLAHVRETALDAYAHQDLPFERLVSELGVGRDQSRTPLFQVMLILQNATRQQLEIPGLTLTPLTIETGIAKFDLTLQLEECGDLLAGRIEYRTDLFDLTTIARMVGHLERLAAAVVADPEKRLSELPLLTENELEQLHRWNDTVLAVPKDRCIHELYAEQAARTPQAVAVVSGGQRLTYAELDQRSSRLARYLQTLGVMAEQRVGLFLERSAEMVIGLLAALKAGGVYLPLDIHAPEERLRTVIDDAGARIVMTQERLRQRLPEGELRTVCLDSDRGLIEDEISAAPDIAAITSDSAAYLIYTSGSTGQPKGVLVAHRAVLNLVGALRQAVYDRLPGQLRVGLLAEIVFDASVQQIFACLLQGHALYIVDDSARRDGARLARFIEAHALDVIDCTPTLLRLLVDSGWPGQAAPALRQILVGGEALSRDLVKRLFSRSGAQDIVITNLYGPTETCVDVTAFQIARGDPLPDDPVMPLGRPLANTRIYILDRYRQPVPVGVAGELCIAGAGLARGYHGDPRLTGERFISLPALGEERVYRSGDLARFRSDGVIEFLGRNDDQVKIRGHRIELGEIEASLLGLPEVRACSVVVREPASGERQLVAYLVADQPQAIPELRSSLGRSLPDYMIPAAFVQLDELPLSASGKVDRQALPEPELDRSALPREYAPPRTPAEQVLADIWGELLGVDRVGIHDNFFELGGDSILSIQVVSRAHRAGIGLSPRQLFEHQTVSALAAAAGTNRVMAEQGLVTGETPLTPIQNWFFEQPFAERYHWNQAVSLELTGKLEVELLAAAIHALICHHDALRLCFGSGDTGWWQRFREPPTKDEIAGKLLVSIDLSQLTRDRQQEQLADECAKIQAGLDLERGELLRLADIDLGEQGRRLLVVIHHLVSDGVSWRILLEDLDRAGTQLLAGEPVDLGAKTTSWQQWSQAQVDLVASGGLRDRYDDWLQLVSRPWPQLPVDKPGGANLVSEADEVTISLGRQATRALLLGAGRAYHTEVNDLLLAALAFVLRDWTRSSEVGLLVEGHGREGLITDADVTRTVGWFTSLFPVRLELADCSDQGSLVRSVKEQLRAIPDRGMSYGMLRYLDPDQERRRRLALPPQAQMTFNYLGQVDQGEAVLEHLRPAREPSGPSRGAGNQRSFLIELNCWVADGELTCAWSYGSRVHQRSTIVEIAQGFINQLQQLVDHCLSVTTARYTPADFPLAGLDQQALDQLLAGATGVEEIYPLTPMQAGMLFHSLREPESTVYLEQLSIELIGEVDSRSLAGAFQLVVNRHSVLRSSVRWQGVARPLQVVLDQVEVPWCELDWRQTPADDVGDRLAAFLAEDRSRRFAWDQAPLLRLSWLCLPGQRHRLVLSHHHLLLDGWSTAVVLSEVFHAYEALAAGRQPALDPAPVYSSYVDRLEKRSRTSSEGFWKDYLHDVAEPTRLAIRQLPGRDRKASEPAVQELDITPELSAALRAFARRHHLTLNTLVQGAWSVLLSRYCGSNDVVFGFTVAGRPAELAGIERMVGLFVNTVPLRVRISPRDRVADWLQQLQEQVNQLRSYETTPLVEVQRWTGVPAGEPWFETLLVFESYPVDRILRGERSPLTLGEIHSFEQTNYPLTIAVSPGGEQMGMSLSYPSRLYRQEDMALLLDRLQTALHGLVADPERLVVELSLVSDDERRQLRIWNQTAHERPRDQPVHELISAQAARAPTSVAVTAGDRELSYGELEVRSNQLAHHLQALGVRPEVPVGVCLPRSPQLVVALLGILKAGGVYVPLDPGYPEERLRFMAEDSGIALLLGQAEKRLAEPQVQLDQEWSALEGLPEQPVGPRIDPQMLAYVIYTSGSTGRPKGVQVGHRSLVNMLHSRQTMAPLSASDRVLQLRPISFDASLVEILEVLVAGACLVVAPAEEAGDTVALTESCRRHGVTSLDLGPSLMTQLFREGSGIGACQSLRRITAGGEMLSGALRDAVFQHLQVDLLNCYGPTETTVQVSSYRCRPGDEQTTAPIGRPFFNTELHILDQSLHPAPCGLPGELYIAGEGLARGYLGRPRLTAERFLPNPFCGRPGARMYRSGDLARYLDDGNIELLGRTDLQVKIRGVRVELGEIEAALLQLPAVTACAVSAREDRLGDQRLVAYIVAGERLETADLRRLLARTLPAALVPSLLVQLDALPVTATGKIDRRRLPAPEPDRQAIGELVAPRTPLERRLAEIWTELLDIDRIGVHDSFFDLGGHSLLATMLVSRVRTACAVELPLQALFEASTIAELALHVGALQRGAQASQAPRLTAVDHGGEAPLSFAQERIWFLDQLEPGSNAYLIPTALRLQGPVDVRLLEQVLSTLVRRHQILRTSFVKVDGRPLQVIHEASPWHLPVEDLSQLSAAEQETEVRARVMAEAQTPFDLTRTPLLRTRMLRLAEQEHVLLVTMHHIISDGWSTGVMLKELTKLLTAFAAGQPSPLPELSLQYADFACWQRQLLDGDLLGEQLDYWLEQLAGVTILALPTDRPRPPQPSWRGAHIDFTLDVELTEGLQRLGHLHDATLYMTLLAVFDVLLYRYSGQTDIVVGCPIANRNRAEIEPLIGFFVNNLVIRSDLSGWPTFSELLTHVRETTIAAFAHQDLPFERLVEAMQVERDQSRTPLFQMVMVLQNATDQELHLPGLTLTKINEETGTAKFDLTLLLAETGAGLVGQVEYSTDLFDKATVERMIGHFKQLAGAVVADPDRSIALLPLLTEAEHQLLCEWSRAPMVSTDPDSANLIELINQQVKRDPERVAVVFEDQQLSYGELAAGADQVAGLLVGQNLQPGEIVAVVLDRSLEVIPALLGVSEAGGAYLPIDPTLPVERVRFMLADSRCRIIISEAGQRQLVDEALAELPAADAPVVLDIGRRSERAVTAPERAIYLDQPAYVIYTSGSTGRPKGCLVTHRNLVQRLLPLLDGTVPLELGLEDVWSVAHSFCFDFSVWETYGALLTGGRCVVAGRQEVRDVAAFLAFIKRHRVTVLNQTPAAFYSLSEVEATAAEHDLNTHLRYVIFGGDRLDPACLQGWSERYSPEQVQLVNMYGITETTVHVTFGRLDRHQIDGGSGESPIGAPLPATEVHICDRHLQLQPVGVPGEVYVGGGGVCHGYLHRPRLTAERFLPDPFSTGSRLYRTGDLARWRADGTLEHLGRCDGQVQVRGYRVEVGEVESALAGHPDVDQAVVLPRQTADWSTELDAFVTGNDPLDARSLRAHLQQLLPDYMLPSTFTQVEAIPLTDNLKVDRRLLATMVQPLGQDGQAAGSRLEEELLTIWQSLLGHQQIGVTDSFFEVGGTSLLLVRLHAEIDKRYPEQMSMVDLFTHATIAGLAQVLSERQVEAPALQEVVELPESYFADRVQEGGQFELLINGELLLGLQQLARAHRLSQEELLLVSFAYTLHEISDSSRLTVYSGDHGNGGIFPVTLDFDASEDFVGLLTQARKTLQSHGPAHPASVLEGRGRVAGAKNILPLFFPSRARRSIMPAVEAADLYLEVMVLDRRIECSCGFGPRLRRPAVAHMLEVFARVQEVMVGEAEDS
jgi:amino acid adenylation domain-containing protein/non-ribosomal peptide synthase protein (TIGR01720 family)